MKSLDVLFITPPTSRSYKKVMAEVASMPPLGQMYMSSNLKKHGYSVDILDMSVNFYNKEQLVEYLLKVNPKIIGISTFIESWSAIKLLSKLIKDILPNVKLVAGGHCSNYEYKNILDMNFDYILFGESEYSFLELCDFLIKSIGCLDDIKGIAYLLENKKIHLTDKRDRIYNLDELPFPDRSLIDLSKYTYPITISTSRGCPGKCIFCSSKSFWGKQIYFRSSKNIYEEIKYINKHFKINEFFIVDDAFTAHKRRALEFCKLLQLDEQNYVWGCESRADIIDLELIENLVQSGCKRIQFGMESSNNEILRKIGKNVTIEQIEEAVKLATNRGMLVNVSFIIGHPFDTHKTVEDTINFAIYLQNKYGANVLGSILTPYPGTDIYHNASKYNIEILSRDYDRYTMNDPIIKTEYLSQNDLRLYLDKFLSRKI